MRQDPSSTWRKSVPTGGKFPFPATISLSTRDSSYVKTEERIATERHRKTFEDDGFVIFENFLDPSSVELLNNRLDEVLRGKHDRHCPPDKQPKIIEGDWKKQRRKRVLQIINIHKSDQLFQNLVTLPELGKIVSELAGWKHGARLAQDQVWAKPPGSPPLVFHRDRPYFMFEPSEVVTVWIALDDMKQDLGPLEYVVGSHLWGDGRVGTSGVFFEANPYSLLSSAAHREGLDLVKLQIVTTAGLQAGGMSIHNGNTWHGSGKNVSKTSPRRGIGLHFVPSQVRFTQEANTSKLWKRYVKDADDASTVELPIEDFPITWKPL